MALMIVIAAVAVCYGFADRENDRRDWPGQHNGRQRRPNFYHYGPYRACIACAGFCASFDLLWMQATGSICSSGWAGPFRHTHSSTWPAGGDISAALGGPGQRFRAQIPVVAIVAV